MKQISLCLTTWKRSDMIIKAFEKVYNDPRIGEIVISSDADIWHEYHKLEELAVSHPKIRLQRNETRLKVYGNKHASVKAATHNYCIIFDSDNVIDTHYLDQIYSYNWDAKTIFAPDFAKPTFDYRAYNKEKITRKNVSKFIGKRGFDCLLNTMNYFVNRAEYLRVWKPKPNIDGADSIFFNKLWLEAGNNIFVVPGLSYFHSVHNGSFYQSVAKHSEPVAKKIEMELKAMR